MKRLRRPLSRALLATALLVVAPATLAWGPLVHRIVADLAQPRFTPAARAEVERLPAGEHAARLADVADWADRLRDDPTPDMAVLARESAPLHYVNMHGSGVY